MGDLKEIERAITEGKASLGIEFGSTRIKAVLVDENYLPVAQGNHDWENRLENGIWTYSLQDIEEGLKDCFGQLRADVKSKYGCDLKKLDAMGFSAMMHGYMPFDKDDNLLVPFRTWRNTITEEASKKLTEAFSFNIPQRWSIAHLYQAILNGEEHVGDIAYITTLAGYIHRKLTGKNIVGVGEASGMFPIDSTTNDYDSAMLDAFDKLIEAHHFQWKIRDILPEVYVAGECAGQLTAEGAAFMDESGELEAGVKVCPPEGDAGTGMVATNSVAVATGNVSAGTSVFAMIVLEKALESLHTEIDMVTTPVGHPVAMVHCNNCTSDLNAWVGLFKEFADLYGVDTDMNKVYSVLYNRALEGDADCGGVMAYNYFSGEPITDLEEGRPLVVRTPDARFSLANFMRANLYSSIATLKIGMDILLNEEKIQIKKIYGHGGLFKTKGPGQKFLCAALDAPVSVMETAGEGGAWGMALLAAYMNKKDEYGSLDKFLNEAVFAGNAELEEKPDAADVKGFNEFLEKYKEGIKVEKEAVKVL